MTTSALTRMIAPLDALASSRVCGGSAYYHRNEATDP